MANLLGRDVGNGLSDPVRSLNAGQPARQTNGDPRCEVRRFVLRSGDGYESGSPVNGIALKHGERAVLMRVSPDLFRLLLGHCFGASATPGGAAPFCFPDSSPRASLGPCSRMHGLALGSRAHSQGFAQV